MRNTTRHLLLGALLWGTATATPAWSAGPKGELVVAMQTSQAGNEQSEKERAAWRAAREALRQEKFEQAAKQFEAIIREQPDSRYVPESYYWRAYALYELGGQDKLRTASETLRQAMQKYPEHSSMEEARDLLVRVQGQLMNQHADREAAEAIIQFLEEWDESHADRGDDTRGDCDDLKILAVTSLLQMNEQRALPLLRKVIEDHSRCPELREKAIFVAAQHDSPESMQLILDAARNDPDPQVRQQAVFWLSQVSGEESLEALIEIAHDRTDREVQEKAVFALSQHSSARASQALEALARDAQNSIEVREQAIFWLGQSNDNNIEFLSSLYGDLEEQELREKILFSISQTGSRQAAQWLRQRALDPKEARELREKALFWLGQMGELTCEDMKKLYDEFAEREMREQLIFGLSQMGERCATRTLIDIARTEKDKELVEKCIFWLGQTGDEEALQFLEELIDR